MSDNCVIIEVLGGCITEVTAPDDMEVRIVDWDSLNEEGIECLECGSTDVLPDYSTPDDWFICNDCHKGFTWDSEEN